MPKQSRGFWFCDFCGTPFDQEHYALDHEQYACRGRQQKTDTENSAMPPQPQVDIPVLSPGHPKIEWRESLLLKRASEHHLCQADMAVCSSIELVETNSEESQNRLVVAMSCHHCKMQLFRPSSVEQFAFCVRRTQHDHLGACDSLPEDIAKTLRHSKDLPQRSEDFNKLHRYCERLCDELGLQNEEKQLGVSRTDRSVHVQLTSESDDSYVPYNLAETQTYEPVPFHNENTSTQVHTEPYRRPFPFFQVATGEWLCQYCTCLPVHCREPHFVWSCQHKSPPSLDFVEYHLSFCAEYKRVQQAYYHHICQNTTGLDDNHEKCRIPEVRSLEQSSSPSRYEMSVRTPTLFGSCERQGQESSEEDSTRVAIRHLQAHDYSQVDNKGQPLPQSDILVLDEDQLLLTEYFYYMLKQLRIARFSEADRRTRGGKRENIVVGYGGLQCIHCASMPNSRKFFWSNVDRLANSFAEIPAHVMKCRHCRQETKDALIQLKRSHPEQMARLPRGSQKVFFRRMWRRLHDNDPACSAKLPDCVQHDERARELSRERLRSSDEAANVLEAVAVGTLHSYARVLLALPEDKAWLSDIDCFIRKQIELFCATTRDVEVAKTDHKVSVHPGQVGIRCLHCAASRTGARMNATSFPTSVKNMYESVRELQRVHFATCASIPAHLKRKLNTPDTSSLSSVLRKYYLLSSQAMGLQDTKSGIFPGGTRVTFIASKETASQLGNTPKKRGRESL